jgi:hypothetical protein
MSAEAAVESRGGELPDWAGVMPGRALADLAAPPAPHREPPPLVPADCCDGPDLDAAPLRAPCPQGIPGCGGA